MRYMLTISTSKVNTWKKYEGNGTTVLENRIRRAIEHIMQEFTDTGRSEIELTEFNISQDIK